MLIYRSPLKLFEKDNLIVEKIISEGQNTPEGEFLEQDLAEWVALLQGEAEIYFFNSNKTLLMSPGDYLYIAPKEKHRVVYTSNQPKCIWLAIHFKN